MNPKRCLKKLLAILLFITVFNGLKAQTTTHSIGSTLPFGIRKYDYEGNSGTDAYYMATFSYGFRHNLSETEHSSFSIGPIISAGGGIYSDSYGSGLVYSGDLQAWADYNLGAGSVPEVEKSTGTYFGLGFGGSYTGVDGEAIDENNGISYGPMIRAGFRFAVGDNNIGVGLYYKYGLESAKWRTFGFHVLVDL